MKRHIIVWTAGLTLALLARIATLVGQAETPFGLLQAIPLPNVHGRLDHMDVDVARRQLFVAGLENGSVEVIDLQAAKWLRSIPGFQKPQGILFAASLNKLFVASGDDGMLRVYRGGSFELLDSIKLDLGPNRLAFDAQAKLLYVGYGGAEAGKGYGAVAIVDAVTDKVVATVQVAGHPAELLLDHAGTRLFVFVSIVSKVQVVDTATRVVTATWPIAAERPGDAAFDEVAGRLLVGTRTPPRMIVLDSKEGKEIARLPTIDGMDGVYYDLRRRRVYVSGGRGFASGSVFAYRQKDRDHYELIGEIATRAGAATSLWSSVLDRYYVAAPSHDDEPASLLVFEPRP